MRVDVAQRVAGAQVVFAVAEQMRATVGQRQAVAMARALLRLAARREGEAA